MKILKSLIPLFAVIFVFSCTVSVNLESPEQAGNIAADFLEQFLIEKNSSTAFSFFHNDLKKIISESKLDKLVEATKGVPDIVRIEAISYTKKTNQKGQITIYFMAVRKDKVNAFLAIDTLGGYAEEHKILGFRTLGEIKKPEDLPGERFGHAESKIVRSI